VEEQIAKSLKIPSGEMDSLRIRKLAKDLRMSHQDFQSALDRLVLEGDLGVKSEKGRRIYRLAPLR
jgi:DNA-binding transcriptional regulator PaaX